MEKIKSNKFLLFWSLLGLAAMIIVWFLPWRFQVNDDVIMMWLVSGAYTGTPESYAVFIHPMLSWTFSKLYTYAPTIPWYPLTWFLVLYLSYILFLRVINEKFSAFWTRIIWALFLFALLIHFLFFLQFSIVAAFAVSAGLASRLSRSLGVEKIKWYKIYPGDILILTGILIREEVPLLLLFGVLGINALVVREKRIYKVLLIPIIFFTCSYALNLLSIDQEFRAINQLRSSVFDHPVLQLNKESIKQSHPDLYHYSNGLIDFQRDPDLGVKLKEWKVFLDGQRTIQFTLPSVIKAVYTYIEHEIFLVSIMVLFIAFTLAWKSKTQTIVWMLLTVGLLLLSPFYLIKVQIYAILLLLYVVISIDQSPSKPLPVYLKKSIVALLVIVCCYHFYSFTKSSENFPSSQNLSTQLTKLKEAGIEDVILIAAGEVYHELIFDKPLPFKVLGWPTLLESVEGNNLKRAYLVDSATYSNNASYFKEVEKQPSLCDQILLISKE